MSLKHALLSQHVSRFGGCGFLPHGMEAIGAEMYNKLGEMLSASMSMAMQTKYN